MMHDESKILTKAGAGGMVYFRTEETGHGPYRLSTALGYAPFIAMGLTLLPFVMAQNALAVGGLSFSEIFWGQNGAVNAAVLLAHGSAAAGYYALYSRKDATAIALILFYTSSATFYLMALLTAYVVLSSVTLFLVTLGFAGFSLDNARRSNRLVDASALASYAAQVIESEAGRQTYVVGKSGFDPAIKYWRTEGRWRYPTEILALVLLIPCLIVSWPLVFTVDDLPSSYPVGAAIWAFYIAFGLGTRGFMLSQAIVVWRVLKQASSPGKEAKA